MRGLLKIVKAALLLGVNFLFLLIGIGIGLLPFLDNTTRARLKTGGMRGWARSCCFLLGIRVVPSGNRAGGTCFIVSNHCSYLDILVIGSLLPSFFISKREVDSWFLLGPLARLAGTVFIDRTSKAASVAAMEEIKSRLREGISVVVFPEGTTNNGVSIRDFKSTLFQVPTELNIPVLPLSLRYSHVDRNPLTPEKMDTVAWYGDMPLFPHFWNVLGYKRIGVRVHFHSPLTAAEGRKVLSALSCSCIREGYAFLLTEEEGQQC
ncbi:MAG: 1-acyl-sn-glycerol-3-phosphate acyltransferase [Alphaproteobacteria bacterium]|uniref:1-acyl-sn-glycerol-3-phosphate acyltransferase n=1 Tax=Candidatus Nitrobium versatile TaxID=2884831 RepID=A0A953J7H8_9BACT|nr:1-acyl-sn-glycerol-3-phosphate acyltransferase [Candidatus Nitrobium versatile]